VKHSCPITPADFSTALSELCQEAVPASDKPFYVNCHSKSKGKPQDCFEDVENHVQQHGGRTIYGWALWEMPKLFVEAEFHAIWQSTEGEFKDIAYRDRPSKRILFLPDPNRTYNGEQINNIRKPLSNNPLLFDYLNTFSVEYDFMKQFPVGEQVVLSHTESRYFDELMERRFALFIEVCKSVPAITPYSPCYCGSGQKVKWCCKRID
jgi:hypothetical protein